MKSERWIEVTERFDWQVPGKRAVVSFAPGYVARMTQAQADDCVAAGKGRDADRPKGAKVSKKGEVSYEREKAGSN